MEKLFHALVIVAGIGGFCLSAYIRHHKKYDKAMVCPLKADCHKVVHSQYSTLFGVPLEIWGMLYYGIIFISYGIFFFYPEFYTDAVAGAVLLLSVIAFFFSIYLTAIQAFVLREWCTWCLCSACICTIIFILAFQVSDLTVASIASTWSGIF